MEYRVVDLCAIFWGLELCNLMFDQQRFYAITRMVHLKLVYCVQYPSIIAPLGQLENADNEKQ